MGTEKETGYFSSQRSSARVLKPFVPSIPRGQQGGYAYHVINRGNGQVRREPFKKFKSFNRFTPFKTLPETYGSIGSNSFSVARVCEWKGSNVQGQIRQELPHVRWQYETISLLFAAES
jgi:hypothetical protein